MNATRNIYRASEAQSRSEGCLSVPRIRFLYTYLFFILAGLASFQTILAESRWFVQTYSVTKMNPGALNSHVDTFTVDFHQSIAGDFNTPNASLVALAYSAFGNSQISWIGVPAYPAHAPAKLSENMDIDSSFPRQPTIMEIDFFFEDTAALSAPLDTRVTVVFELRDVTVIVIPDGDAVPVTTTTTTTVETGTIDGSGDGSGGSSDSNGDCCCKLNWAVNVNNVVNVGAPVVNVAAPIVNVNVPMTQLVESLDAIKEVNEEIRDILNEALDTGDSSPLVAGELPEFPISGVTAYAENPILSLDVLSIPEIAVPDLAAQGYALPSIPIASAELGINEEINIQESAVNFINEYHIKEALTGLLIFGVFVLTYQKSTQQISS